jgi:hypothetical protein
MPYVMVPVPEQHVAEVMEFILRSLERASIRPWDAESINQMFGDVDEASRSLLAFVARSVADDGELDASDAARRIQLTARDLTGIMSEVNARARDADRPPLMSARNVSERLPNGRQVDKLMLRMDAEVAELVRAAEKAELLDAPHPLGEARR